MKKSIEHHYVAIFLLDSAVWCLAEADQRVLTRPCPCVSCPGPGPCPPPPPPPPPSCLVFGRGWSEGINKGLGESGSGIRALTPLPLSYIHHHQQHSGNGVWALWQWWWWCWMRWSMTIGHDSPSSVPEKSWSWWCSGNTTKMLIHLNWVSPVKDSQPT